MSSRTELDKCPCETSLQQTRTAPTRAVQIPRKTEAQEQIFVFKFRFDDTAVNTRSCDRRLSRQCRQFDTRSYAVRILLHDAGCCSIQRCLPAPVVGCVSP
mmetsp:Transcript_26240/g.62304  ORF Transcript_26240/g.62304 Transcript_26240/m.62304 type:complete len:101 (-) Transcript_26240:3301-3603(-)